MTKYYPTIGLEIHAELKTLTKMFCSCKNDPDEEKPNVNICPVCMAHPGALPVANKKAIENVIKVGLAVDGTIADFSEFDRKNYFYPDIPKGYQISQYKYPIVSGGKLAGMDITRIHLEEDTATNKHDRGDFSLIDFNRAGVPLMELVTEPHTFENAEETAKTASNFAKEYQLLLQYLGVSEANMEKGEMRVEANISVSEDPKNFGTKVEVKNLNSFRSVERAIKYELDRMIKLLEGGMGSEIVQETRGWNEGKGTTFSQRKKEGSADYRYFPDPDLPKMKLHEAFDLKQMKENLPELPVAKRERFKKDYNLNEEEVEVYINDKIIDFMFGQVMTYLPNKKEYIKTASNYFITDVMALHKQDIDLHLNDFESFANLISMLVENKISSRVAKDLIPLIIKDHVDSKKYIEKNNLLQKSDEGEIKQLVQKIIDENTEIVAIYKSGKENAIMSLVGKVIKESNGSANPQVVIKLLKEML
jgi:aspartyl-tRNA(Asn)/glutamyl-tRNA(Gln) amidotransferase subunit B